jgi:hypothetical protein
MATWSSLVYQHFKMPPAITVKKGKVVYIYVCIACVIFLWNSFCTDNVYFRHPSITVSRARTDESTSNLTRHVRNCAPADTSQTQALAIYASGSKYTKETHRMKVALWVANRHHPFSIVEDPELLEIFADLNPLCQTPKHHTVSRDVKDIFSLSQKEVAIILQVCCVPFPSIIMLISCRITREGFTLLPTDGHHRTLLPSLESLFIGLLIARWPLLFSTSLREFLSVPVVAY